MACSNCDYPDEFLTIKNVVEVSDEKWTEHLVCDNCGERGTVKYRHGEYTYSGIVD